MQTDPAPHAVEGVDDYLALVSTTIREHAARRRASGAPIGEMEACAVGLLDKVSRLADERDTLRTQLAAAELDLRNLLCVIHGSDDYTEEHGEERSVGDACHLLADLRWEKAAAEARVAELEKAYRTHASHTDDCDWYNDRSPEAIKSEWAGRCDCGMRAALAPPPPSEGATLLRADDAGGTDAGRR